VFEYVCPHVVKLPVTAVGGGVQVRGWIGGKVDRACNHNQGRGQTSCTAAEQPPCALCFSILGCLPVLYNVIVVVDAAIMVHRCQIR
jgi:hypothetical protein